VAGRPALQKKGSLMALGNARGDGQVAHVTMVNIHVKPEHLEEFLEATRENHEKSVLEPGNLRFDVLQSVDDPNHIVLYEAYESPEDAAAHKGTDHYMKWRDTVADWMEIPRVGIRYIGLLP
jgi:autoinducer 2-degrading protein